MRGRPGLATARRARVLLLALLTLLLVASGPATPERAAVAAPTAPALRVARAAVAPATSLTVHLTGMIPAVAAPGRPVTATATVRNATSQPVTGLSVVARAGAPDAVAGRDRVREWAGGSGRTRDPVVATSTVSGTLAPGGQVLVTLRLPASVLPRSPAFGTLPLTVQAVGRAGQGAAARAVSGSRATFLPFQTRKEYQPLSIAFAAPLTTDPDPALVIATGAARANAWQRQLGPGGRLDRIVAATSPPIASRSAASVAPPVPVPVTWAIDPTIVGAHPAGDAVATPGGAGPTGRAADDVTAVQTAFARRLAGVAGGRDVWALPPADPDLLALTRSDIDSAALRGAVGSATPLAERLGLLGAARVAWPVGGPLLSNERAALDDAFGGAGPAAHLAPGSSLDADPDVTGTAARRTAAGRPLLAWDDELSRLLTSTHAGSTATAGETTQRFLAETAALLAQSPGRRRSVLVVTGRDFDPDPARTQALLGAVRATPWLSPRPASELIASAAEPDSPVTTTYRDAGDPLSPGDSPLDPADVATVTSAQADVTGLAQVLSATPTSTLVPDTATIRALLSTRWRGSGSAWATTSSTVLGRLSTLTNGVSVVPSTVNFFADNGILQVTVVNNLDVEVHDVRLVVDPQGRPPRLRLTREPDPLRISPKSRTTVRLQVEAVAAGVVPVAAHLATPSGTRLGTDATVRVRVRPTNGWVMLALGGLVGVVFLAGLYRALRAGSPRVSSEDLKEIDLE